MSIELDFTKEIKEALAKEEGFEEIISDEIWAAEQNKGKKLNKPFRTSGGPKKFSVYVKNEKGNVVKVNFGDPNMEIKRDDPARRKSFRARHGCDNPGPKTKAKYWSCKMWSKKSVTNVTKGSAEEELIEYMDESEASRPGAKSAAQTPAKPEEKKKGSSKNPPGSAGTKPDAKETAKKNLEKKDEKSMVSSASITFSAKVTKALQSKVDAHNKKHPGKKVTLGQLKKVYRRGAGAFSSSHRPGMSRGGWAMARVNMYLKMRRGGKVKDSYRKADQDIGKKSKATFLEDDGDFGFDMEDEIRVALDLREFDIENEEDVDFDSLFQEDVEADHKDGHKGLTDKQKNLPPHLQKAILDKEKKKKGGKTEKKEDKSEAAHAPGKYVFDNPGEAMEAAKKLGLDKVHDHTENGKKVFMPGATHEELSKKLSEDEAKARGLWDNIRKKRERIKRGSGEKMRKKGEKGAPTEDQVKKAQKSKNPFA